MYIIEYFKTDGDVITLQVDTQEQLHKELQSLANMLKHGRIISFNVGVLS